MFDLHTQQDLVELELFIRRMGRLRRRFCRETVRAYKYVTTDRLSPHKQDRKPKLHFGDGETVRVWGADRNLNEDCAAGVNVATASWVREQASSSNQLIHIALEFKVKDIAMINSSWGKFRTFKAKVIKQVWIEWSNDESRVSIYDCGPSGRES